jgi:sigma-B regulation protein RsbU (phosphoserine phosphatase)
MNNSNQNIKELLLLQRVAQRINSILDLELLLEEVVTDVAQTFGYSRSGILLKDDGKNELVIAAVHGWTVNYHIKGDRFKIGEYGIIGHVGKTEELYYAPDVTLDPYYQVSEHSTRSELDIPLKIHGRLIGVFNFQHQEVNAFSELRIQLLEALAGHVATAIENARLFEIERKEKDRLARELNEARNVQLSLFPDWRPEIPGFEIAGICIPCREVGGDWFDYIPLEEGKLAIVLADVSGKGSGAALLMASTRSILRMFADKGLSPGEVLSGVNKILVKDFPSTRFVTMIYAILNPADKSITYSNAAHPLPVFADQVNVKLLNSETGFPLGIQEDVYPEHKIEMRPGSRLLFYSDGISEAMNSNEEEYSEERIKQQMKNPEISLDSIIKDVNIYMNSPAADDMTMVIIKSV